MCHGLLYFTIMFELIDKLRIKGYQLHLEQEMTDLIPTLDKDSKLIFLTRIQYEYYKDEYPEVLLYKPDMLKKLDIELTGDLLVFNANMSITSFRDELLRLRPKKVLCIPTETVMIDYHSDITLHEVLCDQYGIKYEKKLTLECRNLM